MKWLTYWWWAYLFSPQGVTADYRPTWRMIFCRMKGHTKVWWYNSCGLEPDMHCQWCGEDLG